MFFLWNRDPPIANHNHSIDSPQIKSSPALHLFLFEKRFTSVHMNVALLSSKSSNQNKSVCGNEFTDNHINPTYNSLNVSVSVSEVLQLLWWVFWSLQHSLSFMRTRSVPLKLHRRYISVSEWVQARSRLGTLLPFVCRLKKGKGFPMFAWQSPRVQRSVPPTPTSEIRITAELHLHRNTIIILLLLLQCPVYTVHSFWTRGLPWWSTIFADIWWIWGYCMRCYFPQCNTLHMTLHLHKAQTICVTENTIVAFNLYSKKKHILTWERMVRSFNCKGIDLHSRAELMFNICHVTLAYYSQTVFVAYCILFHTLF